MSSPKKFRAWDIDNDSWCSESEIWINGNGIIEYAGVPLTGTDHIEIELFTGLHDDNKNEIYAGDVLHIWSTFQKTDIKRAEVYWNEKSLRFDVKTRGERYKNYLQYLHQCHWFCEVIGNIRQNPELLEADNG